MICKTFTLSIVGISLLCCAEVAAQTVPDLTLTTDFKAQVKSLDEFKERFNGVESKPGIEVNENYRRNNLISLFDFQMNKEDITREQFTKKINCFVDSVLNNNIEFRISDSGLWAECVCRIRYQGKSKRITLILQNEKFQKGMFRWALSGVRGLKEAGIIPSEKFYPISPVEHEIYFLGLQDLINENPSRAFGYRSRSAQIDQLSVFLVLIQSKALKFDLVEEQTFHYMDIPGFIITIKEVVRQGENSGWLITSLRHALQQDKVNYINKLRGYE